MKTTELVVAKSTLVTGGYRSPEVIVTEIFNEGVLCAVFPLLDTCFWAACT